MGHILCYYVRGTFLTVLLVEISNISMQKKENAKQKLNLRSAGPTMYPESNCFAGVFTDISKYMKMVLS